MSNNSGDVWDYLRSSIPFETYSDKKLASLYLDNDFPVHLLVKVFDVITDPSFKLEEITFKSFGDIFSRISACRRQAIATCVASETEPIAPPETRAYSIPPIVMRLVVDRMVEDRLPLGTLAMKDDWENAYRTNVANFHAMSLVCRSWTNIALRGLRCRAIIPYHQIDSFLLSPLCGPWITEMVIYWTISNGHEGATLSDIDLLQALLERTPTLRSLAFITSLVWPIYEEWEWVHHDEPPFRVDSCIELISDLLPGLENLWLRHFRPPLKSKIGFCSFGSCSEDEECEDALRRCCDMSSLCVQLPKMVLLKFLSMRSWESYGKVGWDECPPDSLKTIELYDMKLDEGCTRWLLESRGNFNASTLACEAADLRRAHFSLPRLEKLQLYKLELKEDFNISGNFNGLVHLDLFDVLKLDIGPAQLPLSLQHLSIHHRGGKPSIKLLQFDWEIFALDLEGHIRSLPCLRSLVLTGISPEFLNNLVGLCRDRGIEFVH
ncbi:hypothetical protein ACEPAI_2032 [Sanghuangporus weigelae]